MKDLILYPKKVKFDYETVKLIDRILELERFIDDNYNFEDKPFILEQALANPTIFNLVLDDLERNQKEKLDLLRDFVSSGSKILLIVGERGSGKSSLASYLSYLVHQEGRPVYYYLSLEVPPFAKKVFSLSKVEDGSFLVFDESSVFLNSRDSMTDNNKTIVSYLPILRHRDLSILFITQNTSLIDINTIRLADGIFFKYMNEFSISYEREELFNPIVKQLLPTYGDKSEVLLYSPKLIMKFNYELPDFYDDKLSKSYRKIKNEKEAKELIEALFNEGYEPKDVKKILSILGFEKPLNYYKELYKKMGW